MASGTFKPAVSTDDGCYGGGAYNYENTTLYLGNLGGAAYSLCIRFPSVTIPKDAIVTLAKITFLASANRTNTTCKTKLYGNAADNAVAPTDIAGYNALSRTTATVSWTLPGMTGGTYYDSEDITSIVQEIVSGAGWASGNALIILLDEDSSSDNAVRTMWSFDKDDYDGTTTKRPALYVEWTGPEISGSITIPVEFQPTLVNKPGDMAALFEVPISFSATMSGPATIASQLAVPVSLSGTMDTFWLSGIISVPISIGGSMGEVDYPIIGGLSFAPSISGTIYVYDVVTVNSVLYVPEMEISASAIVDTIGNGYMTLPALTMDATGLTAYIGNALITLPRLTITATAMRAIIGAATLRLPALKTLASTLIGIVANGEITLPIMRVSANSYRSTIATGLVTLPSLRLDSTLLPAAYTNMVINVRNAALTLYTNYGFNSMCHFDGKNLGATATGIHDLDLGDSDVGAAIEWNFKTGYIDLHLKTKKKLREAWLGCKATGDMIVTIMDTDGTAYEYEAKSYEETERGLRVKFGRGYHRRYFSIDVKNSDGGSITLDAIRLILDKYGGRR